ncbi:MAG: HAD family hydrolase [Kiritimatiellia bacterium]|nr:HAD family hydrolase [Kiritimatiellia bacterium]
MNVSADRRRTDANPLRRAALFFDRDGVINRSPGPARYVERPEDFELLPDFPQALRTVLGLGYVAVVVTNQRGVGLGRMSQEALDAIHRKMVRQLGAEGLHFLDIRVCTANDNKDPRRKPNPGMLIEAAETHGLDLTQSWMVGDSETDIEAGRRAGCRTIRLCPPDVATSADRRVETLTDLTRLFRSMASKTLS